tara:strand:+ start:5622 stop:7703 length:2082 start_codon:yes stop_codon:yes gene_type:complete
MSAARDELTDVLDTIDIELYLDMHGIDYRTKTGASGVQLNVRECPVCGSTKHKVFLNAETGLGNCLSGDTEILTREYGAIAIEEVAGQTVTLLDGNGEWTPCLVRDYGLQTTYAAKFASNSGHLTVRSTAEHGWIDPNGEVVLTKDLRRKKDGSSQVADLRYARRVVSKEQHARGVIHGLIYGDGSKENAGTYRIRVCSHHDSIAPHLSRFPFSLIESKGRVDSRYYVARREAWCEFKSLPEASVCDIDYLVGFFRGWLAADGCVCERGTVSLCCGPKEAEWARRWAPVIGWLPRAHSMLSSRTNFGKRHKSSGNLHFAKMSMASDDFLIDQHKDRWVSWDSSRAHTTQRWSFRQTAAGKNKPYEPRVERVYCPEVPTTGSFALANGIHSRNCFAGDHPPGENFNKYSFIKAHIGASNDYTVVQHVKQVAREMGWRPPRPKVAVEVDTSALTLPDSIPMPSNGQMINYLWDRNIQPATAEHFRLRYCENGWFNYTGFDGETRGQNYAQRVLIPVFDAEGKMVSFQGRDITGEREPKYQNPPGYSIAGRYLFNAHTAKGASVVTIGEGAFDVMATWQAFQADRFTRDVVPLASFGMELSMKGETSQLAQLLALKRHGLRTIVMFWDSQPEAQARALKVGLALTGHGFHVRNATITGGKDAAEVTGDIVRRAYSNAALVTRTYVMQQMLKSGVRA